MKIFDLLEKLGINEETFLESYYSSPSAIGYILGAISEVLLKKHLLSKGYEVIRIKEKPSGGNNAKNDEARGDFYIRKNNFPEEKYLVIESKGLKSNSEFRGGKLDSKEKLFKYLSNRIFGKNSNKNYIFDSGYKRYLERKKNWEQENNNFFPEFNWKKNTPGAESYRLENIWKNEKDLYDWVYSLDNDLFSEQSYRNLMGPIKILETHQPSTRTSQITKIKQAAPLVSDFNIMSVDLFFRTGNHDFVFMNSSEISHSPTSPEHLYQNYIVDILVKDKKEKPIVSHPWYSNIDELIEKTQPKLRDLDKSQIDLR
ncbi:hypothetical protein OAK52_01510 [Chloroflexi bacterium]|nr:hypothetical protein [Chloroflexota bacterium]